MARLIEKYQVNDRSLVEQARALIQEELDGVWDHDPYDQPGYKVMIAESLLKLEQVNQLKRIADSLDDLRRDFRHRT